LGGRWSRGMVVVRMILVMIVGEAGRSWRVDIGGVLGRCGSGGVVVGEGIARRVRVVIVESGSVGGWRTGLVGGTQSTRGIVELEAGDVGSVGIRGRAAGEGVLGPRLLVR